MNKRLINKVVFITGGGSWIGKEIAKTFSREHAKVFIIGRDAKKLEETITEIETLGGEASYFSADISNESAVNDAVKIAVSTYGKIDILIQNAGIYPCSIIEEMKLHEWEKVIDVNLTGSFADLMCK